MGTEQVQAIHVRLRDDPAFREQFFSAPLAALQGYDLTGSERLQLILPHFRWAITQRLAGVSRPRNPDAVKILHELGIRAVVTLAEQPLPPGLLEQWDLHAEHIPIPDFTAPALEQVVQDLEEIAEAGMSQGVVRRPRQAFMQFVFGQGITLLVHEDQRVLKSFIAHSLRNLRMSSYRPP